VKRGTEGLLISPFSYCCLANEASNKGEKIEGPSNKVETCGAFRLLYCTHPTRWSGASSLDDLLEFSELGRSDDL
jgi:hypothetical protein